VAPAQPSPLEEKNPPPLKKWGLALHPEFRFAWSWVGYPSRRRRRRSLLRIIHARGGGGGGVYLESYTREESNLINLELGWLPLSILSDVQSPTGPKVYPVGRESGARTCLHVRPGRLTLLECRFNKITHCPKFKVRLSFVLTPKF
jgi:hypothetical protein